MSLLLMESCDLLNGSAAEAGLAKWTSFLGVTDGVVIGGKTCWSFSGTQSFAIIHTLDAADEDNTMIVGMRIRAEVGGFDSGNSSERHLLVFRTGSTFQVILKQRGNDTLAVQTPDGTEIGRSANGVFQADTWYYVEMKVFIHPSTGTVEVKVDGNTVINLTGQDTQVAASDQIDNIIINMHRNITNYKRDIVIMNSAGSVLNDFIGPVVVEAVLADGAGNYSAWTPDTGSNFQRIDESDPDADTSYVEAGSTALRDSYTYGNLVAITTAPLAVQATAIARYTDSPIDLAMMLRRSSTDADGTAVTPSGTYGTVVKEIWEDDPIAAGAWTVANFNATEFGIKT